MWFNSGVPVKCETKSKRNETKPNETKPIETKRNEIKRNETKSGKIFDIFRPEKEKCSMKT